MKTIRGVGIVVLLFLVSGCSGSTPGNSPVATSDWQFRKTIAQPIVQTVSAETTMGSLEENKVNVSVKSETFDTPTDVTLKNPDTVPAIAAGMFTPLGAPIEITSDQRRLNQPLTITLQVNEARSEDIEQGSVWAFYYNGKSWDAVRPKSVDPIRQTITFESYHMSFWGTGKVSVEERIKQYTKSKTLGEMAQEKTDEVVEKIVEDAIDHLLRVQLGMSDESAKYKIISSLANDDDYAEILDAFRRGDATGFNQKMMVFLGKKVAENVEKSALENALKTLSSDEGVEYAEAAAQALGYLYEGDLKGAAEVLGGKIADAFLVTKLFKAAGEIVEYQINQWKDAELEAAYQAYKNGSDDYFWGYNVDKGQFDQVYDQMKGIAVRLESEYVEREKQRRENLGLSEPTDAQLREIREQVRKDLEAQFKTRLSKEEELAKEQARLTSLIDAFDKAKLLENGSFGYDDDDQSLEERLDSLLGHIKRILKDTKKKTWTTNTFGDKESLSMNDLVSLVQALNSSDGEKVYAQALKDKFGLAQGIGIAGDFVLKGIPDPPTNDWMSQITAGLIQGSVIEVKNGVFDNSKQQVFNTSEGPVSFIGNGWLHWSGTYDVATAMLDITFEYGWDGETTGQSGKGKERIVYNASNKVKITPDMKRVAINLIGTITSTKSSMGNNGWNKPWTDTFPGGPTVQFDIELHN